MSSLTHHTSTYHHLFVVYRRDVIATIHLRDRTNNYSHTIYMYTSLLDPVYLRILWLFRGRRKVGHRLFYLKSTVISGLWPETTGSYLPDPSSIAFLRQVYLLADRKRILVMQDCELLGQFRSNIVNLPLYFGSKNSIVISIERIIL